MTEAIEYTQGLGTGLFLKPDDSNSKMQPRMRAPCPMPLTHKSGENTEAQGSHHLAHSRQRVHGWCKVGAPPPGFWSFLSSSSERTSALTQGRQTPSHSIRVQGASPWAAEFKEAAAILAPDLCNTHRFMFSLKSILCIHSSKNYVFSKFWLTGEITVKIKFDSILWMKCSLHNKGNFLCVWKCL